jgi:hypothetical protein
MTANIMSSAPLPSDLQYDSNKEAARDTNDFLASLAYDEQCDEDDGYLSPDSTVQISANTVVSGDYLLPDSESELDLLYEDDLLITPDCGSPLPDLDNVRHQNPPAGSHAHDWSKIIWRSFIIMWGLTRGDFLVI